MSNLTEIESPQVDRSDWEVIREALYDKQRSLEENRETTEKVAKALRAGHSVPPWASGESGARVADEMARGFKSRAETVEGVIERVNDYLYPQEPEDNK